MPIADPQLIHSKLFRSIGITAFFTERQGGVSRAPFNTLNLGHGIGDDEDLVAANMERLIFHASLRSRPHQAKQTHGSDHLICHGEGLVHDTKADILITEEANCPVAVRTADCLPVLLADPVNRIIAAVHAGWRGTAKQVVTHAVKNMVLQGAAVQNIHAALGPSIGLCCFEIGEDTAQQLASSALRAENAIDRNTNPHADLTAINTMQLQETGISDQHIESSPACTCCNPDRFYSYRRDHGQTGRHLAVVALPDHI
jgi:YfiH family protein